MALTPEEVAAIEELKALNERLKEEEAERARVREREAN